MKIGWFIGRNDWTYKNLTEALIEEFKEDEHVLNAIGDVTIIMSADQLSKFKEIRE